MNYHVCILFVAGLLTTFIHPIPEQHIVVVILEYNAGTECIDTLRSVFDQTYHNYQIILIDDCSTNNSAKLIQNFINDRHMQKKVRFIKNNQQKNIAANHEFAVSLCDDNDIVVHVDGDGDMLATNDVLSYINKIYTEYPQTWVTYGSAIVKSTGKILFDKPLPAEILRNRLVRKYEFVTSHLRTFRAWLFKQIKHEDFMYKGGYHIYGADLTFIYPLLEMAGENHTRYVDKVLYIYKDHPGRHQLDASLYHNIINYFQEKQPYNAVAMPISSIKNT